MAYENDQHLTDIVNKVLEKEDQDLLDEIFGQKYQPPINYTPNYQVHKYSLKLGRIRKLLEDFKNLPDDTPIFIERVEDVYFETHGWETIDIKFFDMNSVQRFFEPSDIYEYDGKILINAHY